MGEMVPPTLRGRYFGARTALCTTAGVPAYSLHSAVPQVEVLRTHPLTPNRQRAIEEWARRNDVRIEGARRPLPAAIAALRGE